MPNLNDLINATISVIEIYQSMTDDNEQFVDYIFFYLENNNGLGLMIDNGGENIKAVDNQEIKNDIDRTKIEYKIIKIPINDEMRIVEIQTIVDDINQVNSINFNFNNKDVFKVDLAMDSFEYDFIKYSKK